MSEQFEPENGGAMPSRVAEDDPLAELARIVSGDSFQQETPQSDSSEPAPEDEDFALNLESELMSDLGSGPDDGADIPLPASQPGSAPVQQAASGAASQPAATQAAPAETDPFSDELMQALNDEISAPSQAASQEPLVPIDDTEAELEASLAAELAVDAGSAPGEAVAADPRLTEIADNSEPQVAQPVEEAAIVHVEAAEAYQPAEPDVTLEQTGGEQTATAPAVEEQAASAPARGPGQAYDPDLDLGAAFTSEFEQIAEQGDSRPVDKIDADFAAAANAIRGELIAGEEEQHAVAAADGQAADAGFEAEFGAAFAEELGVEEIEPAPAWNGQAAAADHSDFMASAVPEESELVLDDPGYVSHTEGLSEAEEKKSFPFAASALVVALVAGLAVAGYSYYWPGGGSSGTDDAPVVIKADADPVKVKPEDPGGRVVANRDKASYEKVDGTEADGSEQASLITTTEEPALLNTSPEQEAVGEEKSDDRLTADAGNEVDQSVVTNIVPRKVKTVTVKPDGTILVSDSGSSGSLSQPLSAPDENPSAQGQTASGGDATVAEAKAEPIDGAQSSGSLAVPTASPLPKPKPVAETAPAPQPVAPAPAPQTQPVQLASNQPEAPATTAPVRASEWVVQVSSQRSAEAAQSSYANLRSRFPAIFEGRSMSIQRAAVEGKGTFHRVRIQSSSRNDAIQFCERLKASGGSCFVTR